MKKKNIGMLILGVVIGIGVAGYMGRNKGSDVIKIEDVAASKASVNLVEVTGYQNLKSITDSGDDEIFILKDKETGKKFMLFKGYRKAGLTQIN